MASNEISLFSSSICWRFRRSRYVAVARQWRATRDVTTHSWRVDFSHCGFAFFHPILGRQTLQRGRFGGHVYKIMVTINVILAGVAFTHVLPHLFTHSLTDRLTPSRTHAHFPGTVRAINATSFKTNGRWQNIVWSTRLLFRSFILVTKVSLRTCTVLSI